MKLQKKIQRREEDGENLIQIYSDDDDSLGFDKNDLKKIKSAVNLSPNPENRRNMDNYDDDSLDMKKKVKFLIQKYDNDSDNSIDLMLIKCGVLEPRSNSQSNS